MRPFLQKLANLHPNAEAAAQLRQEFPEFLPDFPIDSKPAHFLAQRLDREKQGLGSGTSEPAFRNISIARLRRKLTDVEFATLRQHPQKISVLLLLLLSEEVQQAWESSLPETREWRISRLRNQVWELLVPEAWELPDDPPTLPLYQAISHLQREGSWARRCGNENCSAPFFFATWKNQKFCGPACAALSKQAVKRKSWKKHPEWNTKRRKRS